MALAASRCILKVRHVDNLQSAMTFLFFIPMFSL